MCKQEGVCACVNKKVCVKTIRGVCVCANKKVCVCVCVCLSKKEVYV